MKGLLVMMLSELIEYAVTQAKAYIQKNWRWGEKKIELVEDTKTEEKPPEKPKEWI